MTFVAILNRSTSLALILAAAPVLGAEGRTAVVEAVERVSPAVVSVRTKTLVAARSRDPSDASRDLAKQSRAVIGVARSPCSFSEGGLGNTSHLSCERAHG